MIDRENAFIAEGLKERLRTKTQNGEEVYIHHIDEIVDFVAEHAPRIIEALERNLDGSSLPSRSIVRS
jgi:hypothetical protein